MNVLAEAAASETKRLAELLSVDPFGPAMERGFWNPTMWGDDHGARLLSDREAFGVRGAPFTMRLRFLPTDEILEAVRDAYGEKAEALLSEWRALFDRIEGGVERFANQTAYQEYLEYSWSFQVSDQTASRLMFGRARPADAAALYAAATDLAEAPAPRRPVQHALEDALVMTSFVRNKVPVTFLAMFKADREDLKNEDRTVRLLTFSSTAKPRVKIPSRNLVKELRAGFRACNPYWGWPSFRKACGRALRETVGVEDLTLTLLDMARQGASKAFLKNALFKGGTWVIELEGVQSESDAACTLIRALGPEWPRLLAVWQSKRGTERPGFIVQEFRPFKCEHRFFVVGDRIVASTPSDRTLSILDAQTSCRRLDPRVAVLEQPAQEAGAYDRGTTSSVVDRKMVADMARLVRRLIKGLDDDFLVRLPLGYVVDVGCGPDGIGLIEVNTMRNSGLYALDYEKVAKAFRDKASRTERPFTERLFGVSGEQSRAGRAISLVLNMANTTDGENCWQAVGQDQWRAVPTAANAPAVAPAADD